MAALRIRFGAQSRWRWRAWLALAAVAGLLGGIVIGTAAAAKRTDGAYRRYIASINGADVYVDPFVSEKGDSIPLDPVASLPQVAQTERSLQLAIIARGRHGRPLLPVGQDSMGWVLPTDDRKLDRIDRLKLLRGRLPDPTRPNEVIGDTRALHILGADVGATFPIRTIRQHSLDADTDVSEMVHLTADPLIARWGRLVRLHVVGVAANARVDVDGGQIHMTPAFFHAYGGRRLGAFIEELEVRLKHGQADLSAFKRALARYAGDRPFLLFEPSTTHPQIQHSIDLEARALWLIAGLAAIAAIVIVGQMLIRLASDESRDDATLRALGADARDQLGYAAVRAGAIAVPATIVAALVAFLVSPLAPIGWARELDPKTGFAFDTSIIGVGAAAVFVVVMLFGLLGAVRALLAGDARRQALTTPAVDTATARFLRRHGSPAFAAGVRMAVGVRSARAGRGTLAAAVLALTVSVTALTFAASFNHLTSTPRLYGQTWDYETFSGPTEPPKIRNAVRRDPGLTAAGAGSDDTLVVNGKDTGVRAWDDVKGHITPTITEGRAPRALDEVALGVKTLDATGAHVDGHVGIRGRGPVRRMHVVGRVVLPSSKFNKLGYGAMMTFTALKRLDPSAQQGLYLMRLVPGPPGKAAAKRLDFHFDGNVVVKPDEVGDFGRIDKMPFYIALLVALAAGAALAHALVVGVRHRRHDIAILKTLGFTRGQVAAAVAWQATAIVAVGAAIGIPLGLTIGRFAWTLFARDLGVAPEVIAPVAAVVLVLPVALIAANVVAAIPGWLAARVRPAPVLRTE